MILALYILADARRGFRGDAGLRGYNNGVNARGNHGFHERSTSDRRSGRAVAFPLRVNGEIILEDRRKLPDRRRQAAFA